MKVLLSTPVWVSVHVIYFRPDYKNLLQDFLWQTPDVLPEMKRVHKFLNYWKKHIEAPIHTVEVAFPDRDGQTCWRNLDWLGGL